MIQQSCIIYFGKCSKYPKMTKNSSLDEQLKSRLNRKKENCSRGENPKKHLQGEWILSLLFLIAMTPLIYIFRKWIGGYKFTILQEKINQLMYMNDIKLLSKIEKEIRILIQTIRIYIQYIEIELDKEKCVIIIMKMGKREIIERKRTNKC